MYDFLKHSSNISLQAIIILYLRLYFPLEALLTCIFNPLYEGALPWTRVYLRSQVRISAGAPSGFAWLLYKSAALWGAMTESRLGTLHNEQGISSWFLVSVSSRLAVESDVKPHSFFPLYGFLPIIIYLCSAYSFVKIIS